MPNKKNFKPTKSRVVLDTEELVLLYAAARFLSGEDGERYMDTRMKILKPLRDLAGDAYEQRVQTVWTQIYERNRI